MGRHLNLGDLSEDECEKILQVIQRDFDVRQREKDRLGKIEEEINKEQTKSNILAEKQNFNDNCCMRCFSRFVFLWNTKVQCAYCKYFTCKSCSDFHKPSKEYVCHVCEKQGVLQKESCEWFYTNVRDKFKRFGSAKVVRHLYKRRTDSDSETDTGYDPHRRYKKSYSSTEPTGRRGREPVIGLFDSDNNRDSPPQTPVAMQPELRQETTTLPGNQHEHVTANGTEDLKSSKLIKRDSRGSDGDSTYEIIEEDIVASKREDIKYQSPYTCGVSTGRKNFDQYKNEEVERFRRQLDRTVRDMHKKLKQEESAASLLYADDPREAYGQVLEDYENHIKSLISNLSQSLHIAVDDQNLSDDKSPTAKHHLVNEILSNEVQNFVGKNTKTIQPTRFTYKENDRQSQKAFEDDLTDAIIGKVIEEHKIREEEKARRAEEDVRNAFTKLSNKATLQQLRDYVPDSETDNPDTDAYDSEVNRADDTWSDSHISEISDKRFVTTDINIDEPIHVSSPQSDIGIKTNAVPIQSPINIDNGLPHERVVQSHSTVIQTQPAETKLSLSTVRQPQEEVYSAQNAIINDIPEEEMVEFSKNSRLESTEEDVFDDHSENGFGRVSPDSEFEEIVKSNSQEWATVEGMRSPITEKDEWSLVESRKSPLPFFPEDDAKLVEISETLTPADPIDNFVFEQIVEKVREQPHSTPVRLQVNEKPDRVSDSDEDYLSRAFKPVEVVEVPAGKEEMWESEVLSFPQAQTQDPYHDNLEKSFGSIDLELSEIHDSMLAASAKPHDKVSPSPSDGGSTPRDDIRGNDLEKPVEETSVTKSELVTVEEANLPEETLVVTKSKFKTEKESNLPDETSVTKSKSITEEEAILPEETSATKSELVTEEESTLPTIRAEEYTADESYPEINFVNSRSVPLPSFETVGGNQLDLDDISRKSDNEDDQFSTTMESEILFGSTWNNSGNLFRDISAYDNMGEKKVGKDVDGPVVMFVPNTDDQESIRNGGNYWDQEWRRLYSAYGYQVGYTNLRDIEEPGVLSEISDSDNSRSDFSDDEDIEEVRAAARKVLRKSSSLADSSVQTDLDQPVASPRNKKTPKQEEEEKKLAELQEAKMEKLRAISRNKDFVMSTEGKETDPKFVVRPQNVTAIEGEPLRFECELAGTEPMDVFWYKDNMDLVQMDEDERCDVKREKEKWIVEMLNPTKDDTGTFLCIGVNDIGQCNQTFHLAVKENTNEKAAPEFLKVLQDVETVEGRQVKFRCKVKGYPQPVVMWLKDGKRLKNGDKCKIEKIGNRDYMLVVNSVTLNDDAEYTVLAKNIAGEARSSAQLLVDQASPSYNIPKEEITFVKSTSLSSINTSTSPLSPISSTYPLSPVSPVYYSPIEDTTGIYPDTQDLLKVAEKYSAPVKENKTVDQLSSMHKGLDVMDRKLNNIEDEVTLNIYGDKNNNEMPTQKEETILKQHQEKKTAAKNVREVTTDALDVLSGVQEVVEQESPQNRKRKLPSTPPTTFNALLPKQNSISESEDEEFEPQLTFEEFNKLYNQGLLSGEQFRSGKVKRKDWAQIEKYLEENPDFRAETTYVQNSHDLVLTDEFPSHINCGPKRVDSKRYKRDYVINRENGTQKELMYEVKSPSLVASEIVTSTPAGAREDVQSVIREAEEQIYITAGNLYGMEDEVRQTEYEVKDVDEDTSPETLKELEEQTVALSAQVAQNDADVTAVERKARRDHSDIDERPETQWRRSLSPVRVTEPYHMRFGSPPREEITSSYVEPMVKQIEAEQQQTKPSKQWQRRGQSLDNGDEARRKSSPIRSMSLDHHPSKIGKAIGETVSLKGETAEEVVPVTRIELEEGAMPSVKALMQKFTQKPTEEPTRQPPLPKTMKRSTSLPTQSKVTTQSQRNQPSGRKTYTSNVHSITGRNIPEPIREKLRDQSAHSMQNPNIRVTRSHHTSKPSAISVFQNSDTQLQNGHDTDVKYITTTTIQATKRPASQPTTNKNMVNARSQQDTNQFIRTGKQPDKQRVTTTNTQNVKTTSAKTKTTEPGKEPPHKKGKNTAIMQRAAYWDNRVKHEQPTDKLVAEQFPDFPADTRGSGDTVASPAIPMDYKFSMQL